jgi:hypothetical protein
MRTFHFDEGVFDIPAHWSDRTVNILTSSKGATADFSLVTSREELGGREFTAVLAAQMKELSKQMPGFRLLGQRETTVGGLGAIESRISFNTTGGQMYQRHAAVAYYGKALFFTATTLFKDAEGCDAALDDVLASLKLRLRDE